MYVREREREREKLTLFGQVLIAVHDSKRFLVHSQVFVVMPLKVKGGPEAEARVLAIVSRDILSCNKHLVVTRRVVSIIEPPGCCCLINIDELNDTFQRISHAFYFYDTRYKPST